MSKDYSILELAVEKLKKDGFKELGGSDVYRLLIAPSGSSIKVFYNNYNTKDYIIISWCS